LGLPIGIVVARAIMTPPIVIVPVRVPVGIASSAASASIPAAITAAVASAVGHDMTSFAVVTVIFH
jgi:hypothetical protein